jgi:LPS-assembly lipoprotein
LLLAPLGGCGFEPLYAERGKRWDPALAAIKVGTIPDRLGQRLALSLREQLNPDGVSVQPRYLLSVGITVTRSDLGIRRNATSARSQLNITANFSLLDVKTGAPAYSNSSRAISDFNVLQDGYATLVAEEDAQDRALEQISNEIILKLSLFIRRQRGVG